MGFLLGRKGGECSPSDTLSYLRVHPRVQQLSGSSAYNNALKVLGKFRSHESFTKRFSAPPAS